MWFAMGVEGFGLTKLWKVHWLMFRVEESGR